MDPYKILGVTKSATAEEIKLAYRRLANTHHPDKGGDTATFQEIKSAYEILSDPVKKNAYDNPQPEMRFSGINPEDFVHIYRGRDGIDSVFEEIFTGRRNFRNANVNVAAQISLEDAFYGKKLIANIRLPSGKEQVVEVTVPPGIHDGATLRLAGMGDDRVSTALRGDLHFTIHISPHPQYQRHGDDLIQELEISVWDAILGGTTFIKTIDNKSLEVKIAEGVQFGQFLNINGHGMPNFNNNSFRGRLLLRIKIKIPTGLTEEQKSLIRKVVG